MTWEFTADEFMHVWKETELDRYPFPLRLRSSVQWQSEYDQLSWDLQARMPSGFDPNLSAALRVLTNPAMSLLLMGKRRRPVRIFAAVDTTVGITLVQRPGPTDEFGGNVVIEAGSPAIVAKVFAAVLGKQEEAGRHPALIDSLTNIRTSLESWTGSKITTAERMQKLLRAPRAGTGHIEVRCGLQAPRPYPPQYVSWFDVEGDGRYTYRQEYNDFRIDPASTEAICREMTGMMRVQDEFSMID